MSGSARYPSMTRNVAYPFPQTPAWPPVLGEQGAGGASSLTALSIEFVAKPQEARHVETTIPAALTSALSEVDGFAGSLVMVSDQEARLVTVVALWAGASREKRCRQNLRGIRALLAPYLDRCLRVQTMIAHLAVTPVLRPEKKGADKR